MKQTKSETRKAKIIQYYIDNPGASIHKIRREFKPISKSRIQDIIEEYHLSIDSNQQESCAICKKGKRKANKHCLLSCVARKFRMNHRLELNCSNCGKMQIRIKSDIRWNLKRAKSKSLHVFCSSKCLGEYLGKIWDGEQNSRWWFKNQEKIELLQEVK